VLVAIFCEVAGTTSMKLADGFSKPLFSVAVFIFYGLSFTILIFVLKKLEVSSVYAVWSGMGTLLVAIIGIMFLNENASFEKLIGIAITIFGVVLITLGSGE
jgi:small multidrug resistance pump